MIQNNYNGTTSSQKLDLTSWNYIIMHGEHRFQSQDTEYFTTMTTMIQKCITFHNQRFLSNSVFKKSWIKILFYLNTKFWAVIGLTHFPIWPTRYGSCSVALGFSADTLNLGTLGTSRLSNRNVTSYTASDVFIIPRTMQENSMKVPLTTSGPVKATELIGGCTWKEETFTFLLIHDQSGTGFLKFE